MRPASLPGWTAALWLGYETALHALPRRFRDEYRGELRATFADVLAAASRRGRGVLVRSGLAEIAALLRAGVRQRLGHDPLGSRRPTPGPVRPLLELGSDLRYAARSLAARPVFTLLAILTLGAGIAAGTTSFSIVDAVVLRPLPYRDAGRLVRLMAGTDSQFWVAHWSPADVAAWEETDVFEEFLGQRMASEILVGGTEPRRIKLARVTPNFLDFLGVQPRHGRGFMEGDGVERPEEPALIHHELAVSHFGSAGAAVDQRLEVEGDSYRVIGVMPPGFSYPDQFTLAWVPRDLGGFGHNVELLARMLPGTGSEATQERTRALSDQEESLRAMRLFPAGRVNTQLRRSVFVLFAASTLLVLIACANTANLVLAQAHRRQAEYSIRAALGAGRIRLLRQSLLENGLLAGAAGIVGTAAAGALLPLVIALAPRSMVGFSANVMDLDLRALGFALLVSTVTAVGFGLLPALRVSRTGLGRPTGGTRGATGGMGTRMRGSIVTLEIAMTLVLMAIAVLLGESLYRLGTVDLGFDPDRLASLTLQPSRERYPDGTTTLALARELAEGARRLPGVESAAIAIEAPPGAGAITFGLEVELDRGSAPDLDEGQIMPWNVVSPGFLATVGIDLLRGRDFTDSEPADSVIVNDALAETFFGSLDVLGRRFRLTSDSPWLTIVGVTADIRAGGPVDPFGAMEMYRPFAPDGRQATLSVLARTSGNAAALLPGLRRVLENVDPLEPVTYLRTGAQALGDDLHAPRFYLTLVGVFALTATLMAALGVFGIVSFVVGQRRREIGVRMALGATPADIRREVVRTGLRLGVIGTLLGGAAAWSLGGWLDSVLFDVSATDPLVLLAVAVATLVVATLACWAPAGRAAALDPARTLRSD